MRLPGDHPTLGSRYTSKVPHAKKPKPRPPRGWRDKVIVPIVRALPTYTGPYPVGTMEIEVPAGNPRTFSDIKRNHKHLLQLETVLMTVYYPANTYDVDAQGNRTPFSRQLWLGRPRVAIAEGYGRLSGVGPLALPVFLPTMFTKLPAFRNAPVARYWAPEMNTNTGGIKVKREAGHQPDGAPDEPVFPLILFSHGLCGTRTMYSSLCGEFASYGFVVCAVEHRDGSGPRTYINHPKQEHGQTSELEKNPNLDHTDEEKERGFDIIDYIFPKDNPQDTSPHNEKGIDSELRRAQTDLRIAELEEAYRVLCEIADGNGKLVEDRNLRRKGYKGSSKHGLKNIDWQKWKGRFDKRNVTICGHSFGGATAVDILRQSERFDYISQGIIYDMWGAAAPAPAKEDLDHRIRAPIIAINSEAFTYWPSNFKVVENVVNEVQNGDNPSPSWLMTLRGTVHLSQSDFSLLYPYICALFFKNLASPQRALDININASLEFLNQVLPAELAQVNRAFQNENFLKSQVSPLSKIPSFQMHKPEEKWMAVKLDIHHEWIFRLSPKLFRKAKRWGEPSEPGDEIWLHIKPSADTIGHYCRESLSKSPEKPKDTATTDHSSDTPKGSRGEPCEAPNFTGDDIRPAKSNEDPKS